MQRPGTAALERRMASKAPNIVMIMADNVGIWNLSCYHRDTMGGSTGSRGSRT